MLPPISLTHTQACKYEGVRITSLVLTHTQASRHPRTHKVNMKPDVSACEIAVHAFDFEMGSESIKCMVP